MRFNALPLPVRERLYAIFLADQGDPRLLAFEVKTVVPVLKYLGVVTGAAGALVTSREILTRAFRLGIGSDPLTFLIFAGALFVLTAGLLTVLYEKRWPPAPWRPGRVALPGSIVDVHGGWLDVTLMSELTEKPQVIHVLRNGSYTYSSLRFAPGLEFSFGKKERATEAANRILDQASAVAADPSLDPFAEWRAAGFESAAIEPTDGPRVAARPLAASRVRWIVSLVVALGAAAALRLLVYRALSGT